MNFFLKQQILFSYSRDRFATVIMVIFGIIRRILKKKCSTCQRGSGLKAMIKILAPHRIVLK